MATGITAKVICDSSQTCLGVYSRLTTIEAVFPRIILAELNTHRTFSRNSASSRAIPVSTTVGRVVNDPFVPQFGRNQKGMQEGAPFTGEEEKGLRDIWLSARDAAVYHAKKLSDQGVHKSVCNRLIEPFSWHTCIISSTEWENFFSQRCSHLAEPHMQVLAYAIRNALQESQPRELKAGEWHAPYLQPDDFKELDMDTLVAVSAARCARVSYLTHDGQRDIYKDLALFDKLSTSKPGHWSPLEHVARVALERRPSNFGWMWSQLRQDYEYAAAA